MEYSKLVAVTGLSGLYELINSKGDGAIVRSLDDKSTKFISSRVHNFSHLESIEVFTVNDNVNLAEIFLSMQKMEEKPPDERDATAVRKYFEKVYPDLDFEKVYHSDLKKMLKWFSVLQQHKIEVTLPEEESQAEEGEDDPGEPDAEKTKKAKGGQSREQEENSEKEKNKKS